MKVVRRRGWEVPEAQATPEALFWDRRRLLTAGGLAAVAAPSLSVPALAQRRGQPAVALAPIGPAQTGDQVVHPFPRAERFAEAGRAVTAEEVATTYNNFYEFGSHKQISRAAQRLTTQPWQVRLDGMVETPMTLDAADLERRLPREERVYRFRCVEAWAMTVPFSGYPLAALVALAKPLSSAKYVRMETFQRPEEAPGQRQFWYPWPYIEGLTIEEATNELAFIATGAYGKSIVKQMGAPLRLVTPWKYGFKSIKSIVRFTFTDQRPKTFWEVSGPSEYGFWANVNPEVPHPRWSQASERLLGNDERVPTQVYNGYGEWVAGLYRGLPASERLFM
ncbi:MAG: protein-methionine-sulfoxide reductase catalytic subunit MsrP [Alphaproteobacteria bacterium]|nr:protein-methionine-sulfoxide reductase catalytic subunit MsrP [Alphaproteobacteria bacterium]TAD91685.1 MAG: protein-methionine-sulfoxide reductase catalytic subunit MsrP [Alphaproteobacteria bacterium]